MWVNDKAKKRFTFIGAAIETLQRKLKKAEETFFGLFDKHYVADLEIRGNKEIKIDGTNFVKTNKALDTVAKELQEKEMKPIIKWMGRTLRKLFGLNWEYFEEVVEEPPMTVRDFVLDLLLAQIGMDKEGKLLEGGWLEGLTDTQVVAREVKGLSYKSLFSGQSLDELRENVGKQILGDEEKGGLIQRHFRTVTYDAFQQFDRETSRQMAKGLGLTHAIYQGGLIKTSRPFCIERNDKVFTQEEIALFGTPQDPYGGYYNKAEGLFRGRNEGYQPFTDLGGHNCRHTLDWISEALAVQLRPDLKPKKK